MKSCYLPQRFGSEDGNNCKLWNSLTCFRSPDRSAAFSSPLSAFSPLQLFFLHQFPHSYSALFLAAQQQHRRWCFYLFIFPLSPPSAISPALSGNSQIKAIPKKKNHCKKLIKQINSAPPENLNYTHRVEGRNMTSQEWDTAAPKRKKWPLKDVFLGHPCNFPSFWRMKTHKHVCLQASQTVGPLFFFFYQLNV